MLPAASDATPDELLRRVFATEGIEFLGVADVPSAEDADRKEARDRYHRWLVEGRQGTMGYLERHEAAKYDPSPILKGTRSVIVAGLGYFQASPGLTAGGMVARYAWGRDYHKVLLSKLRRAAEQLALL